MDNILQTSLPARKSYVETPLYETAIVVDPNSRAQVECSKEIVEYANKRFSIHLPIVNHNNHDGNKHIIVLGNMSNNRLIRKMYQNWYCIVDHFYPGPGGYAIRSIHNPYGTGNNIILLGASDDSGLHAACSEFLGMLNEADTPVLGWLMRTRLASNHNVSDTGWIEPNSRPFYSGIPCNEGYTECSRAGLIYYYNGNVSAAEEYKTYLLNNDLDTGLNHYYAHMYSIIWELVEESPVFTEDDRLRITSNLYRVATGSNGTRGVPILDNMAKSNTIPDRHQEMQAICTLLTSRYFRKRAPAAMWDDNAAVVKRFFSRQLCTGKGASDLLSSGIYTYLQCALMAALLTDDDTMVKSGALKHWADLCLMICDNLGFTVDSGQGSFTCYPYVTLAACSVLLNDGSLLVMQRLRRTAEHELGYRARTSEFMTGQAWDVSLKPIIPTRMVGIYYLPLTAWEYEVRKPNIPLKNSFDKLTLRAGFESSDQYLLIDGIYGGPDGKHWPNANAIVSLTQNNRQWLVSMLDGENPVNHNVVSVTKNGFGHPPGIAAAIVSAVDMNAMGYCHTKLPDHPFSEWDRKILWKKGHWFIIHDKLTVNEDGEYSMECNWHSIGMPSIKDNIFTTRTSKEELEGITSDAMRIVNAERYPLTLKRRWQKTNGELETTVWESYYKDKCLNTLKQRCCRRLKAGDSIEFTNMIWVYNENDSRNYDVQRLDQIIDISGDEEAAVRFTPHGAGSIRGISGSVGSIYVAEEIVFATGVSILEAKGLKVISSQKCHVEWNRKINEVIVDSPCDQMIEINDGSFICKQGKNLIQLDDVVAGKDIADSGTIAIHVQSKKKVIYKTAVQIVVEEPHGNATVIGDTQGQIVLIDEHGEVLWSYAGNATPLVINATGGTIYVGDDDEQISALDLNNGRCMWRNRLAIKSAKYPYPWWTTNNKAMICAIVTGDINDDGKREVICGTGGGDVVAFTHAGEMMWDTHIEYGVPDRLHLTTLDDGSCVLLVNRSYKSSSDTTWLLGADGAVISRDAFRIDRHWDMGGVPAIQEIQTGAGRLFAIGRKGAYNEVGLYRLASGEKLWLYNMGDAVTNIAVANEPDQISILVSSGSWLCKFAVGGEILYTKYMPDEILQILSGDYGTVVKCNNGCLYEVDGAGKIRKTYDVNAAQINAAFGKNGNIILATNDAELVMINRASQAQ